MGARSLYESVLASEPQHPDALHFLGLVYSQEGNFGPALDLMESALALRPDLPQFHGNLANALRACGERARAVQQYHAALQINPHSATYRLNLGNTLWELEQFEDAHHQFCEALRRAPELAEAHHGLGLVYKDLGLIDEALASLRRALELKPAFANAASAWLYMMNYHPDREPEEIFAEHCRWGKVHADPLTAAAPAPQNDRDPKRRLRVGYVSSCFRDHAVNFFVEPILEAHDRRSFEVLCYSDVTAQDRVTDRLRSLVPLWRSIIGLSNVAAADLIRRDEVDILVDLNGHMGSHRLLMFAMRPAPIQATYLGYQATTGMKGMDYRLTDAGADPPGLTERWHTETLVRIPEAFFCYRPPIESPAVNALPCRSQGSITFGSFNNFSKVTPQVLTVWAELLRRLPDARLHLLVPDAASLRHRVLEIFRVHGDCASRVSFVPRGRRGDYLRRIQAVDIALDPFPFNGHTTTCDALWMGVPVVVMRGRSYVQRYGSTPLLCLGLDDLVAETPEKYVATAIRWAQDVERLARTRDSLRGMMATSVLLDARTFTARLEEAYRQMWYSFTGTAQAPS